MSGPVDVLADLQGVVRIAKAASLGVTGNKPRIERAEQAIAAMSELIEAAKEFSDLYGYLWDVVAPDGAGFLSPESVKKYDDAHGKLMAALASCGGAK